VYTAVLLEMAVNIRPQLHVEGEHNRMSSGLLSVLAHIAVATTAASLPHRRKTVVAFPTQASAEKHELGLELELELELASTGDKYG
jgi:hypothetical protein